MNNLLLYLVKSISSVSNCLVCSVPGVWNYVNHRFNLIHVS